MKGLLLFLSIIAAARSSNLCASYENVSQPCITEDVLFECATLQAHGCLELVVMESCPLQLTCALRDGVPHMIRCPTAAPANGSACNATGLSCTITSVTCPDGASIDTSWATCSTQGTWQLATAKSSCQPAPRMCCAAMTARCLACSSGMTVEQFCTTYLGRQASGCKAGIESSVVSGIVGGIVGAALVAAIIACFVCMRAKNMKSITPKDTSAKPKVAVAPTIDDLSLKLGQQSTPSSSPLSSSSSSRPGTRVV